MKFRIISFIAILSVLILSISGCEDDNLNEGSKQKSTVNYVPLDLNFYGTFDPNSDRKKTLIEDLNYEYEGTSYTSKLKVDYNLTQESVIEISIQNDFFETTPINIDDLENDFNTYIENGGGDDDPNDGMSPHAQCIEACKDKYTDENGDRIRGRGACKANCWVDTGVRVLRAIGSAFGVDINIDVD